MVSEAKHALIRIFLNYARLGTTLGIGLIFVPFVLQWIGESAFGLISLVGSTIGLANLLRFVIEQSLIRELGAAYHSGDDFIFRQVYNAAFLGCAVAAIPVLLVYGALMVVLPFLNIPTEWVPAARWMVGSQGVFTALFVFFSPPFSIYIVKEQFGWVNFWKVCDRATELAAALILSLGFGVKDIPFAIKSYGVLWSSLLLLMVIVATGIATFRDPRLIPSWSFIDRSVVRRVLGTLGWSSGIQVANVLHEFGAMLLMNLAFGLTGNTVYSFAFRLASYTRMVTTGVTHGLDAVATRISTSSTPSKLRDLVQDSAHIHAIVAFPCGVAAAVMARPLLQVWVGTRLEQPELIISMAVPLTIILSIGVTARSVGDALRAILYGSGNVSRYALVVMIGGITSPLLSGALLMLPLPESIRFTLPSISLALVYAIVNFLILPKIAALCMSAPTMFFYRPMLRPFYVTALCGGVLILPRLMIQSWSLPTLLMTCLLFGLLYGMLTWLIVLRSHERAQLVDGVFRILRSRSSDHVA